ncbi:hypothetical protein PanWU01x14_049600 [Parasponia andersonii]|uniref:Uncharacterized protein n=1 Tax=Parasponia andersonii TaxID=3476 RepID=A0A2P5DMP0_PARAD|nr:hypothetical protein PanWU01x14_049600 [Parasponia andersonii]
MKFGALVNRSGLLRNRITPSSVKAVPDLERSEVTMIRSPRYGVLILIDLRALGTDFCWFFGVKWSFGSRVWFESHLLDSVSLHFVLPVSVALQTTSSRHAMVVYKHHFKFTNICLLFFFFFWGKKLFTTC